MVQPYSMYQLFGALITLIFAGALAFATAEPSEDVLFLDLADNIQCELDYGRKYSKVVLADFVSYRSRIIQLLDSQGQTSQMHTAECAFEENLYICRWGKTHSVTIDMSNTSVSEVTAKPKNFIHGYAKLDVFRPKARISCPLSASSGN